MSSFDISKIDLYAVLGVSEDSTEKEIVKSYRKQALKCHPDKNPDNPDAAELFHKLSKALEVLTDAAARAAYDKIQKAKKAAELRHRELDSKRKKLKEDLEARESVAQSQKEADISAKRNLQAEIERLRKEGSKLLEQEQEFLLNEIKKGHTEIPEENEEETKTPKLKIKWKAKKGDDKNGGYSYTVLYGLFVKYGDILNLLVSNKKNGSAIIEFSSRSAAELAENEKGLKDNSLTVTWLEGKSPQKPSTTETHSSNFSQPNSQTNFHITPPTSQERDYEDLVLMKLRQAGERKRLIEQMQNEDDDS